MDEFWRLTAAGWTAIFTLGLLLVAIGSALYARRQWKLTRDQANDARRAEAERLRPYVIVTVEPSGVGPQLFDLVIRNIGIRPALNIVVSLDPEPRRVREAKGNELAKAKMLTEPIAMLAPGQELRSFYDSYIDRGKASTDDLPTFHHARLQYSDSFGTAYKEQSTVDLEPGRGTLFTTVYTVHDLAKSMKEIEKRLQAASIMDRSGSLEVDAAYETRASKLSREQQEEAELRADHDRIVSQLMPKRDNDKRHDEGDSTDS